MRYILLIEVFIALIIGALIVFWVWKIRKTRILWDNAWSKINIGMVILSIKWGFAGVIVLFVDGEVTWFGIIYEFLTIIAAIFFLFGFRKLYYDLTNPYAGLFSKTKGKEANK